MKPQLVLSLFPGIGLLDQAWEEVWPEACIVRGPDLLWGGEVQQFHPPAGRFDGILGGPPCQVFSRLRHIVRQNGHRQAENLIPEFERCVTEAQPHWFLMENVPDAPLPAVPGYAVTASLFDNRDFGSPQSRRRRISFGLRGKGAIDLWRFIEIEALQPAQWERAVCASEGRSGNARVKHPRAIGTSWRGRRTFEQVCSLQGLPPEFLAEAPFTIHGKFAAVGNGVPLPMGRAIARAVRQALESLP